MTSPQGKKTIYVDLDGTLAYYGKWNEGRIGSPVDAMVKRVKDAHNAGHTIVIFTARLSEVTHVALSGTHSRQGIQVRRHALVDPIEEWCSAHLGFVPRVTCIKGFEATEFWDDRAVRIGKNTGEPGDLDGTLWATLGGSTRTE